MRSTVGSMYRELFIQADDLSGVDVIFVNQMEGKTDRISAND